jgi:hypothetical protein
MLSIMAKVSEHHLTSSLHQITDKLGKEEAGSYISEERRR